MQCKLTTRRLHFKVLGIYMGGGRSNACMNPYDTHV